jgi:hypothetical protein
VRAFAQSKSLKLANLPQLWPIGPAWLQVNLLKPRLVKSHSTVTIPFDDRVILVRSLDCAEFSSRLSEVAPALDAISGIQLSGLSAQAALPTAMRCAVDALTSKVSSIAGDSKSGLNMSLIV